MIFCVEDDNNIRDLLVYTLETTGFHARGLVDSQERMAILFWTS